MTCVWLQPFYPSPNRDNGYDVADFYGVQRQAWIARRFRRLHAPRRRTRHPRAHRPGRQPHVDRFALVPAGALGSARRFSATGTSGPTCGPRTTRRASCFQGQQKTTWTKDRRAGKYYFHRFYDHQPDLNTWHPYVRAEIQKIMGFWLQLGVSGFRMDAVPFLIEKKGAGIEHQMDFNLLKEMRDFLQWRSGRGDHAGGGERAARREPGVFRRRRRSPANDAELPGEPAPLLRARHRRPRSADSRARGHAPAAAQRPVGAISPEPRRARPWPADRRAATEGIRGVRAREAHAALRSRNQTTAGADARQRSAAARARVQPAVLTPRAPR